MIIGATWGEEKSGKSSFALSWPKPLVHFDLDVGGFGRASWRLPSSVRVKMLRADEPLSSVDFSQYDIVSKPYPTPVQIEKMMGAKSDGISIRFPRRVVGMKELWQNFVIDYVTACQNPLVQTLVPDSGTQLWQICHHALLQEKQEIQMAAGVSEDKIRERLQPIEFPNDRMRSIIFTARSCSKNLVLTHYPRDVYTSRINGDGKLEEYKSGKLEVDGFKETVRLVDIVIWTYAKEVNNPKTNKPEVQMRAKITECAMEGMGKTAVGLELPTASYDGLMMLQQALRGV